MMQKIIIKYNYFRSEYVEDFLFCGQWKSCILMLQNSKEYKNESRKLVILCLRSLVFLEYENRKFSWESSEFRKKYFNSPKILPGKFLDFTEFDWFLFKSKI